MKLDSFGTNYLFPLNRSYEEWGTIISKSSSPGPTQLLIQTNNNDLISITYSFASSDTKVSILEMGKAVLCFEDSVGPSASIFIRSLNKPSGTIKYYIEKEAIILQKKEINTDFIKKVRKSKKVAPRIITIDIETIVKDGVHKAYLFSMYDGNKTYSWFSKDAKPLFDMVLRPKYKGYQIYAHNLSRFDIIFLFKDIADLKNAGYKITVLKKEDKFISIQILNRNKNVSLTIKDSFLLLPSSLASLSRQLNAAVKKGIEPVFTGDTSSEYYMDDLSHYSKDIERISDLEVWKEKVQTYCEQDCISLYQVICKFRDLVFDKWNINIDKFPTVPSLAFAIFRGHYSP